MATTATFMPVVAAIAIQSSFDPLLVTAAVAIAASCAFMLPVATPPNAIVFGSGLIRVLKWQEQVFNKFLVFYWYL